MRMSSRRRPSHVRKGCLLLFLCLGFIAASGGYPQALAATGSRASVIQAVTLETLPVLEMNSTVPPETLQDFARLTIDKLSAEAPFKEWKEATAVYYPLGPGTRSWLVNVMNGEQRIGYLIISATDQGGYMLSEYGAGTYGLPYSLTALRQFLVQEGLIHPSSSEKLELTPLYAPLLPVWKIWIDGKVNYLNASVPQLLPWSLSKAEAVVKEWPSATNQVTSLDPAWSPRPVYQSGGTDDPYADLQWLTSPKLAAVDEDSLGSLMLPGGSIAYQAAGRNDRLGAPFMITGYQHWLANPDNEAANASRLVSVYAASGPEGKRYLPLSALQTAGTLHMLSGGQK